MDTILEGIIVIDLRGVILLANNAASGMFGYSEQELKGQNVGVLMPISIAAQHDGFIQSYLSTGRPKVIGIGREVTGRRKDGSLFPIELSVGEIRDSLASGDAENTHVFIGTVRDISARKKYEEALIVSRRMAESASEAKSMFLAKMSHELRTPLNAILGFSEIMKEQLFGPLHNEKYVLYLNDIHNSGQHLLNLINDLLDISRIESGKFYIDEDVVDIAEILERTTALFQEQITRKGLRLERKWPSDLPKLRADRRSVRQILINLLSNAVKFTPEGGTISVESALGDDSALSIAISDTGIGMTPQDIASAIKPFGRSDGHRSKENEGAGLGLFIAKSLMEMHCASLDITSQPNHGSTVSMRFPPTRVLFV
ncbi:two-component system, cell cycle sensor histidine kinase PleC [Azospirillaceae bacterium]